MEVNEAIKLLKKFKQEDSHEMFRDEEFEAVIDCIKSLESKNKALKQENKAYKGMWKELKPTDDYECLILEERHLLSKMGNLENKYLGGGE